VHWNLLSVANNEKWVLVAQVAV